jgi:hypothetical protein
MAATVVKPPIASAHAGRGLAVMLGFSLLIGLLIWESRYCVSDVNPNFMEWLDVTYATEPR